MNTEILWKGKPLSELSRDELIEVINYCGVEIEELRKDRDAWFMAADVKKYLMEKAK